MTFEEYQRLSRRTAISRRAKPGDVIRPASDIDAALAKGMRERVLHWTIGLTNEAGEVAGVIKKAVCRDQNNPTLQSDMLLELGDVLWYLTQLGAEYGLTLADIADANIQKLMARHPEKFGL